MLDYNKYKGGVDTMDQCLAHFTTKRKTRRWPLAFFYNILDIAAYAAYITYMENNPHFNSTNYTRRLYLQQVAEQLGMDEIVSRSQNAQIMRHFGPRSGIESMLGKPINAVVVNVPHVSEERDVTGRIQQKGKCHLCVKRRATRKECSLCCKPVCVEHSSNKVVCKNYVSTTNT